ncbi:MAG TPA: ATP-binding protein, partial [Angustibacter sp.]|nr:ATP-binding protein [Angustibacter sp.]
SVRHAPGGLSLAVQQLDGDFVVAVTDSSSAPPQLRDDGPLADNGRGLMIVARVSRSLGWARTPTGKVVWARVSPQGPEL